jgi:hypothetical protein
MHTNLHAHKHRKGIKLYIYMNIKKLNGNSNSIYIIDFITMAFSSNK